MPSQVFISLRVPADAMRTFEVFTREISIWWQPDALFPITSHGDGRLEFEPGINGRLLTRTGEGEEFEIGRIKVWEPGIRLVFSWRQQNFPPEHTTEVEVRFTATAANETRVAIQHRAWDELPQKQAARHNFPEAITLQRVADWWRTSLFALQQGMRSR
jgi:uncharacterized protein YndB with AHSA1/START domain